MNRQIQGAKKWYFQARMTAMSMAMSVLIYGGLGYFLAGIGKISPVRPDERVYFLLKYGAFILSAVLFIAAWQLTGRMLAAAMSQAGPRSPQKLFTSSILINAAAELPAVLGLVLLFLSGNFMDFLPFAGMSLVGFFFAFPRKQKWAEWTGEDL